MPPPRMAERSAGWYDDEADAAWLRYWDGRGWTPHTAVKAVASVPARPGAAALDGDDDLAQPLMQTIRLVPEHTTVPAPPGDHAASAPLLASLTAHPGGRLPRGRVALIVVGALAAGSLVLTLASSVAMLLFF